MAALLANGEVLIAGGQDAQAYLSSAERYTVADDRHALGDPCTIGSNCWSGFCSDTVCCDAACAGPCDACAAIVGAAIDGTCTALSGRACDDGNACTVADSCEAGACASGAPLECSAIDACRVAGVCDPATGLCNELAAPDATSCDDADSCTSNDTCKRGSCEGVTLADCHGSTRDAGAERDAGPKQDAGPKHEAGPKHDAASESDGSAACYLGIDACVPAEPHDGACRGSNCSDASASAADAASPGNAHRQGHGCSVGDGPAHEPWAALLLLLANHRRRRRGP